MQSKPGENGIAIQGICSMESNNSKKITLSFKTQSDFQHL